MFPSRMALSPASLLCGPLEELQELAFNERPIRRSLKTAEEIDQLTVDEDLNDIERAVYLLSVGQEVQRASVISNLPSLVRQNPAETFRRVVPKVRVRNVCHISRGQDMDITQEMTGGLFRCVLQVTCPVCVIQEVLNGAGGEIQLAAAASFLTILQDDIILIHTHTYSILKTVLLHLNHRDSVVSNAWLETLLLAINALPKETIKQEVLNPLLYQSQLSHSLQARLASCRILGRVTNKFDSHIVKKDLLPLALSLCQDLEFEVRACMCRQLESIARATGVDDTRTELLPELLELAGDEESNVRLAAFDTIINLMDMMDSDDRLHIVVPLVMSVCDASSQADKAVLASLSFQFGKVCSELAGSLSDEQKGCLLQRFKVLCVAGLQTEGNQTDGNSESTLIRCNCCYNLPAMVLFVDSAHFLSELHPSFSSLCFDPEVSVRRSAAASFHQVLKLLGSNVQLVHKEFLFLLQDESLEVLDALMNHLEETLEAILSRSENLTLDNKFPELLSVLLMAEQKVGCSLRWRLHEKLLQRYSCLARLLPGELLHQSFSPRIFIILTTNKVLPVQKEAARMFCTFLRYNRKQEHRQEMIERLIQDLAQGRSYWNRLRFLDICETATEIFSRKYFNKYFLVPALELVHDPVANVRYKLCQLLPRLRSSLRLPADKQLLQKLDFCVQKLLCREKDKDVVATIRKTVLELDKLDLSEPFHKRQERDLLDQKKEKEETLLLEMLERQQNDGKLNSDKHTERKRRDSKTSLSATKSMSMSSSGAAMSSSGKETRKAKLSRSRSLSSQPTTSKPVNSERPLKVKDLSGTSGPGKSSVMSTKDDSLRTAHFTMATQSASSMPVLIRSNTTSLLDRASTLDPRDHRTGTLDPRDHRTGTLDPRDHRTGTLDPREHRTGTLDPRDHRTGTLDPRDHRTGTLDPRDHRTGTLDPRDHRTSTLDHRTSNMDHRNNMMDHRTSTLDHRTSANEQRDHRTSANEQRDHRTSSLDQRSKTMERGCGVKDSQSRKLSINRKSNSFSVQSGRD
ncbi:serine/threonine-protein phosphatase 4 regulatory subunit 4 isoform X2 [Brachyistius frenatus]|uniref:serine/threonine-protein phosphatase 4 regulatory subunit 4 isoform X2 n=1 Tax=Brachyistius frenatus TaxID=100188 RepID=UPI0037E8B24F